MGGKSLHLFLQFFHFTLGRALFLLKMSNADSSTALVLKHIFTSFVDKSILLLQIKMWFCYVAERSFETQIYFFARISYIYTFKCTKIGLRNVTQSY